jgi:general secretion pathway protein G
MSRGMRKKRGFTLIELLIVVLIITILAAITIPTFSETESDAELNVCLENLRIIQYALSLYQVKAKTYPPDANGVKDYFRTMPVCPLGGSYSWDLQSSKYHVKCDAQHAPDVNHVCIHENQPPTPKP